MAYGFIERFKAPYTTITFGGTQAITKVNYFLPYGYGNAYSAATTLGEYAVFAGGQTSSNTSNTINTVFAIDVNSFLLRLPDMYTPRRFLAAATVKDMSASRAAALFAGGLDANSNNLSTIEVYYQDFTHDEGTLSLPNASHALAGVTFGDYAIFAGGQGIGTKPVSAAAFSANWTRTILSDLSSPGSAISAACNSNYAIFAGGYLDSGISSSVTAYDSTLVKATSPSPLSSGRVWMASGTAGDYALFVGGETSGHVASVAEAYDKNLNKVTAPNYTWTVRAAATTSLGSYLLIMGGMGNSNYYNIVRYYDSNLVLHETGPLFHLSKDGAAASAGEYAYFYGGHKGNSYWGEVDVYHLPNKVTVYPGTRYKLGSMANEVTASSMQTITTEAPISGYIKIKNANLP